MDQKRILVVDDNEAIHYDFRKALDVNKNNNQFNDIRDKIFPEKTIKQTHKAFPTFIIDSAFQGLEAVELVEKGIEQNQRYLLAFIDMLMPPGIDGVTTIEKLWKIDPDLQIVICTAHADYSYEEIYDRLEGSDNFLILKKPFDIIEILQLAASLTKKWELTQQARSQLNRQQEQINFFFQEADFLYRLSQLAQTEFFTKDALQFFITGICSLRNWPVGHIYPIEENQNALELASTSIWHLKEEERYKFYKEAVSDIPGRAGIIPAHFVLDTKAPYWIENLNSSESFPAAKHLIESGVVGALAIPIMIYDNVIAIAEFFSEQPLHKDQQLSELTIASANQLGLLLERRKNEKELNSNYKQLQELYVEMQNTQAQLLQQAKLASIGQLAAGVAHEINNPIAFIISNTGILNNYIKHIKEVFYDLTAYFADSPTAKTHWDELSSNKNLPFIMSDIEEILKESLEGLERVREIVADLKSFSHMDEAELQDADINHCIDVTLKMIWNELKYKCVVMKHYGKLPTLRCYARQLNQVFMNLLVNASQAIIGNQGEITITTQFVDNAIQVIIQDNGEGIPAEYLEKLFEPFFTTKPVGTGTGLGLAISYNIVKKHSGEILVESPGRGKGTKFTVILPVPGVA